MSSSNGTKAQELGYDAPTRTQGKYLRLESKGDTVRIRIVSKPYRFSETLEINGKTKEVKRWAWVVIHKEIIDNLRVKTVRAFKAGAMIYGLIYDYVVSEDWGDPTHYDLTITRTEERGRYYTVTAMPKPIGPISEEEKKLVEEAALDLEALFSGDAPADSDDEDDPFADD